MKHPRIVILATLVLSSCGTRSTESKGAKAAAPRSDLVRPVAAPVQLGKSVLRDLKKQTRAANQRKQDFDSLTNEGR